MCIFHNFIWHFRDGTTARLIQKISEWLIIMLAAAANHTKQKTWRKASHVGKLCRWFRSINYFNDEVISRLCRVTRCEIFLSMNCLMLSALQSSQSYFCPTGEQFSLQHSEGYKYRWKPSKNGEQTWCFSEVKPPLMSMLREGKNRLGL